MADLTITAASVLPLTGAKKARGLAGATITAGQAVYRDASTGKYLLADSDSATAPVRELYGIALNGASDGQPIEVQTGGDITIGATLTAGTTLYLSPTAGGICPLADIQVGDYYSIVGIAISTSVLRLAIANSGVARAS